MGLSDGLIDYKTFSYLYIFLNFAKKKEKKSNKEETVVSVDQQVQALNSSDLKESFVEESEADQDNDSAIFSSEELDSSESE